MLTTNRTSRLRLVSGCAAVAMLTVAGLGLTASGTQAAERVRSGMEKATGVSLAELNPMTAIAPMVTPVPVQAVAPVAAPEVIAAVGADPAPMPVQVTDAAPVAPPAPAAPPASPAPPAPPALGEDDGGVTMTVSPDGKVTRRQVVRIVRRDGNGEMVTGDFRDMPNIPDVSSRNCPGDGGRHEMVLNEKKGGKRVIIICANRIEKVAREGAAVAARSKDIERNAYRSALEGLRNAQARMRSDQAMGEVARNEAIKAIDEAIRDMEDNLNKAN